MPSSLTGNPDRMTARGVLMMKPSLNAVDGPDHPRPYLSEDL